MHTLSYSFVDHFNDPSQDIHEAFEFAARAHRMAQAELPGASGAIWFRGQADWHWELIPSLGRPENWPPRIRNLQSQPDKLRQELLDHEAVLLQRFRRDAVPFVERRILSMWEAIILGQHYGLCTRLLDWTSDVFVALFFAAEEHRDEDAAVFAYRPLRDWTHHLSMFEGQNPKHPDVADPLRQSGIKIVFPIMIADRLIAQSGGLTIQDPLKCLMERAQAREVFGQTELDIAQLIRWRLPKESKVTVLDQLHRYGTNRRRLFPGLETVARTLVWQEQFRSRSGGYLSSSLLG